MGLAIASRAPNLLVFQIAFGGLVGGAGGAFFAPLMATTIGWFNKHRSLAVSPVSIGGGVAPMVVTPFASVPISIYGWRPAMLMIGTLARRSSSSRPAGPGKTAAGLTTSSGAALPAAPTGKTAILLPCRHCDSRGAVQ